MKNPECPTEYNNANVVSGTMRGKKIFFGGERDFQHLLNPNRQINALSDHAGSRVPLWCCV